MSTAKVVVVRCDGADIDGGSRDLQSLIAGFLRCEERFVGDEYEPVKNVRERAKAAGWTRTDGAWDYCPKHGRQGR